MDLINITDIPKIIKNKTTISILCKNKLFKDVKLEKGFNDFELIAVCKIKSIIYIYEIIAISKDYNLLLEMFNKQSL
jgi:hypothetical protein